jgi:hypothetical protein
MASFIKSFFNNLFAGIINRIRHIIRLPFDEHLRYVNPIAGRGVNADSRTIPIVVENVVFVRRRFHPAANGETAEFVDAFAVKQIFADFRPIFDARFLRPLDNGRALGIVVIEKTAASHFLRVIARQPRQFIVPFEFVQAVFQPLPVDQIENIGFGLFETRLQKRRRLFPGEVFERFGERNKRKTQNAQNDGDVKSEFRSRKHFIFHCLIDEKEIGESIQFYFFWQSGKTDNFTALMINNFESKRQIISALF